MAVLQAHYKISTTKRVQSKMPVKTNVGIPINIYGEILSCTVKQILQLTTHQMSA